MTEKELKSIKFLKLEIKRTEREICSLVSGSRNGTEYKELLTQTRERLYSQKCEIERLINDIDDAEIRLILKLKFVDLRSWNYIARTMNYDRSTVYKKYKKFIRRTENEKFKTDAMRTN